MPPKWVLCLVLQFISCILCQKPPYSPCPDVFQYRQDANGYYGEISVPYDGQKVLKLNVTTSMVGLYKELPGLKLTKLTPSNELSAGNPVKYRATFPFTNIIPRITRISYNGQIFCSGPPEELTTKGVTTQWAQNEHTIYTNYFVMEITSGKPPILVPSQVPEITNNNKDEISAVSQNQASCGRSDTSTYTDLLLGGDPVERHQFPWIVALFNLSEYFCTATLVSDRHVVTAAHCLFYYKSQIVPTEDLVLVMGVQNIRKFHNQAGSVRRDAKRVVVHPQYDQATLNADVAVILTDSPVSFSLNVRPICLGTGLAAENGEEMVGTVAGWARTATDGGNLTKTEMPIVTWQECKKSYGNLGRGAMSFCAGYRNGRGPCFKDSGGGFYLFRNNRWHLKGVISNALVRGDVCDLEHYVLFADVSKMRAFLQDSMA